MIAYLPGDTIGILPQHSDDIVNEIFDKSPELKEKCHDKIHLKISPEALTLKKVPKMPVHLPSCQTSLFKLFQESVDLNGIPKKAFLSALVNNSFLNDNTERRYLEILASREGSALYTSDILQQHTSFYSLLSRLKSWNLTIANIAVLFEHLPRLMPRPYSIANSALATTSLDDYDRQSTILKIMFSLNNPPGITTRMLQQLIFKFEVERTLTVDTSNQFASIYARQSNRFQFTEEDLEKPLLMVAIGTGIAPFIGFLEHIQELRKTKPTDKPPMVWLIFGCRYWNSQLCSTRLIDFVNSGILTKFSECYSKEMDWKTKYVQDAIRNEAVEVSNLVIDADGGSKIFVCGNKAMVADVKTAVEESLVKAEICSAIEDAKQVVDDIVKSGRYIEDIWI